MLVLLVLVGLVINGVVAHIVGNLGKEKKIGYATSFLVSFLLSPIIGILMVIASVPNMDVIKDTEDSTKPDTYRELTEEEKNKLSKTQETITLVLGLIVLLFILYVFRDLIFL
jgi:hypothetical protein